MPLDDFDRDLIAATRGGLPLVSRPYEAVGAMLGVSGEHVRERLDRMRREGILRRIGAVPNPGAPGVAAGGMSVWDIDDAQVDVLGARVAAMSGVSHCRRRPRHQPGWPYNLFAVLHGRTREDVERLALHVDALLGTACRAHDVLFATEILKKTGWQPAGN
jgi:DNA-binding Lrp family transcriptional regulator